MSISTCVHIIIVRSLLAADLTQCLQRTPRSTVVKLRRMNSAKLCPRALWAVSDNQVTKVMVKDTSFNSSPFYSPVSVTTGKSGKRKCFHSSPTLEAPAVVVWCIMMSNRGFFLLRHKTQSMLVAWLVYRLPPMKYPPTENLQVKLRYT